jgi:hypothetical protein
VSVATVPAPSAPEKTPADTAEWDVAEPFDLPPEQNTTPVKTTQNTEQATPVASSGASEPPGATPAAPSQKHNPRTLALAAQLGIPDAEIANLPPDRLDDAVFFLTRQRLSSPTPQGPPPAPTPEEEPLTIDWGQGEDGRPVSESEINPGIVNAIKSIAKENRDLKKQLTQTVQAQSGRSFDDTMDAAFANAPPQLFGKGPLRALAQDGEEAARRQSVVALAMNWAGAKATPEQVAALLPKAQKTLFGFTQTPVPQPAQLTDEEKRAKESAYIQQHAHAATTQRQATPEPAPTAKAREQAALKGIQEQMARMGHQVPILNTPDDDAGLPD